MAERFIYKYSTDNLPINVIELPSNSILLKVAEQEKRITFWFSVNPDNEKVKRVFYLRMTGDQITTGVEYIETILMSFHGLEAHLFEKID